MTSDHADGIGAIEDEEHVVVFRLGHEEYGAPIESVHEIVRVPELMTRLPKAPAFIKGVVNLRGCVLPVVDQRTRLGLEDIEPDDRQRIMVFTVAGVRTGFIVDSVTEVLRIPRHVIRPTPGLSSEPAMLVSRFAAMEKQKRMILLIDVDHLLARHDIGAVREASGVTNH